ncbi:MAG: hypothetical protein PW789_14775 [Edaphobacter sp.]|uniref:hypothetical protein n=1 Tax=Edaphobacter sp. TaxID=1934404 RepID=UPI0023A341E7|nr:hypothetical protein [Edaphobacter sp.]MDE1177842.1 hypothetical protein [Edaphobacter sp.]
MTPHLTHEQLCDLLLSNHATDEWIFASPELEAAHDHVDGCPSCAAELATLVQSMTLFRTSTDAWSHHAQSHQSLVQASSLKQAARHRSGLLHAPLAWAAGAALALAIAVPYTIHHMDTVADEAASVNTPAARETPRTTQSDEALLEEVNQTISSSVPTPMQPLADPTASQTTSSQRKN